VTQKSQIKISSETDKINHQSIIITGMLYKSFLSCRNGSMDQSAKKCRRRTLHEQCRHKLKNIIFYSSI